MHIDDKVLTCFSDIKGAFMKHFASALAGTEVDAAPSFEQFLCRDLVDILVEYPSFDISDTAKSDNLLSGAGTDTFKYIVYKHFPHLLEALRPFFHFSACNSPLLQWYIYILQELFKNKGDPHKLQSYRDILLANTSGKHFSRSVRMNIVPSKLISLIVCVVVLKREEPIFALTTLEPCPPLHVVLLCLVSFWLLIFDQPLPL